MRKTGSRDPRESREASAVSPFSIAVNTFSIRLGSRRNQRPLHQKIRSITTVSPMIDTIKIGHMIGPPLWNLSINQLLERTLGAGVADGATLAAAVAAGLSAPAGRSEEHTSELQSRRELVCRLLLVKNKSAGIKCALLPYLFLLRIGI